MMTMDIYKFNLRDRSNTIVHWLPWDPSLNNLHRNIKQIIYTENSPNTEISRAEKITIQVSWRALCYGSPFSSDYKKDGTGV